MNIYEAVKILNDATEKYDGLEFIAETYFLRDPQAQEVSCNIIFDNAAEALSVCRALECLLTYVYQNPPKKINS
jgi:hypothetical protein